MAVSESLRLNYGVHKVWQSGSLVLAAITGAHPDIGACCRTARCLSDRIWDCHGGHPLGGVDALDLERKIRDSEATLYLVLDQDRAAGLAVAEHPASSGFAELVNLAILPGVRGRTALLLGKFGADIIRSLGRSAVFKMLLGVSGPAGRLHALTRAGIGVTAQGLIPVSLIRSSRGIRECWGMLRQTAWISPSPPVTINYGDPRVAGLVRTLGLAETAPDSEIVPDPDERPFIGIRRLPGLCLAVITVAGRPDAGFRNRVKEMIASEKRGGRMVVVNCPGKAAGIQHFLHRESDLIPCMVVPASAGSRGYYREDPCEWRITYAGWPDEIPWPDLCTDPSCRGYCRSSIGGFDIRHLHLPENLGYRRLYEAISGWRRAARRG